MNSSGDRSSVGQEPIRDDETAAVGYEPPAIVSLGSVDDLTAGEPAPSGT